MDLFCIMVKVISIECERMEEYSSIISAWDIATLPVVSKHSDILKSQEEYFEQSLMHIGAHIPDEVDDEITSAYLDMTGVNLPHVKMVVEAHHLATRCNTIKRIDKLWEHATKTSTNTQMRKHKPAHRQISYDHIALKTHNTIPTEKLDVSAPFQRI